MHVPEGYRPASCLPAPTLLYCRKTPANACQATQAPHNSQASAKRVRQSGQGRQGARAGQVAPKKSSYEGQGQAQAQASAQAQAQARPKAQAPHKAQAQAESR